MLRRGARRGADHHWMKSELRFRRLLDYRAGYQAIAEGKTGLPVRHKLCMASLDRG